ncbi:Aldo/keto reductase [Mycena galopus ATCC 62051]|nr:Aldo/keto reductase [Mycena galopus ATCC 62051]
MDSTRTAQKTALNIVIGAMTFDEPGSDGARVDNVQDVEAIFDFFLKHGHNKIDTARAYCAGTSEVLLGKTSWQAKGILIASKLFPLHPDIYISQSPEHNPVVTGPHTPEGLRKALMTSLKALSTDKLDIWYLHAPDRSTPYEVTLEAIDELYLEGHFKKFRISNYMSWEVTEIVGICKQHGYSRYNAIHRLVEPELFPALRKFGIVFYGYNPRLYWKPEYFAALASVRTVASAHGLTMSEVALRWMAHHSFMRSESGDAVIIGRSNLKHIEEKGPLSDDVGAALDAAWADVKGTSSSYFN